MEPTGLEGRGMRCSCDFGSRTGPPVTRALAARMAAGGSGLVRQFGSSSIFCTLQAINC